MPLVVADLLPEPVQPEVCELEHEARVDDAVRGLQVAVGLQLAAVEDRRQQEGGDWNKELTQASEREADLSQKLVMLE